MRSCHILTENDCEHDQHNHCLDSAPNNVVLCCKNYPHVMTVRMNSFKALVSRKYGINTYNRLRQVQRNIVRVGLCRGPVIPAKHHKLLNKS